MSLHVQKILKIVIIGVYAGLVFALKEALAILPNIEVVTFLLSFAALVFPLSMSLTITLAFNLCEILLRGIATWVILYLIAWPLIVFLIWLSKKIIKKHWWIFIIINSVWGFSFGTLDSFIHLWLFGKATFYMYWIRGLTFDAIHGISNFMVAAVLYKPVMALWESRLKYYIINTDFDEIKIKEGNVLPTLPLNS